jgi:hypothetical protein
MKLLRAFLAGHRQHECGKIYISGTGRSGTTFLTQLLTHLEQDTGFKDTKSKSDYFPLARAGLEKDIFDKDGPRIIKSPFLCDQVDKVLAAGIKIDHVVIPVRNFHDAAESRRQVQIKTSGSQDGTPVAGGLWDTDKAGHQEQVIALKFGRLVEALVRHEIPMTFLSFPRLALDPDYLYERIRFMLPGVGNRKFADAFAQEARPELIGSWPSSAEAPGQSRAAISQKSKMEAT